MKFKCEIELNKLISWRTGVWLWSAACLSPVQRTLDPGLKADEPHQNHPFVIKLSQSGKLLGGGKCGRSMFSRVGEWCLNTKINFFHFQKHYLFIILKFFIFFFWGGVKLADAPRSQLCPGSLWPVRTRSVPLSAHGRQGRVARLRAHSRQLRPASRDGEDRESKLRNWPGVEWGRVVKCVSVGYADQETPINPFFFFLFSFL